MNVILKLMIALLEYLDVSSEIVQICVHPALTFLWFINRNSIMADSS